MSCCAPRSSENFDDDREGVSDRDLARFGGDDVPCPACGADVYFDAAMCNACGHAMTEESQRRPGRAWVPLAAAGAVLGTLLVIVLTR